MVVSPVTVGVGAGGETVLPILIRIQFFPLLWIHIRPQNADWIQLHKVFFGAKSEILP
jgi:hypothetical protein